MGSVALQAARPPKLLVRRARPQDRKALLEITSHTWGGHDYIPLFLDEWLESPGFWVGELEGRVVGCGKLTQLSPGEWWLEGLRVTPRQRRRGVGVALSMAVLRRALQRRASSVRLATAGVNRESLRIIGQMGMRRIASLQYFGGRPRLRLPAPESLVVPCLGEALAYVRESAEYRCTRGLLGHTWRFRRLDRPYLLELHRAGRVCALRRDGALQGLMLVQPHRYRPADLDLSFVAGTPQALTGFRGHIAQLARASGARHVSAVAASPEMCRALQALGLRPQTGFGGIHLFELPLSGPGRRARR